MSRKPHDTYTEQVKAAGKRRRDGCKLIDEGHLRGGMYLLGYAVECRLKAYVMRQLGADILRDAEEAYEKQFREPISLTSGHDLTYLCEVADSLDLGTTKDGSIFGTRQEVCRWRHHWRYEWRDPRSDDARRFRDSVLAFDKWVTKRL